MFTTYKWRQLFWINYILLFCSTIISLVQNSISHSLWAPYSRVYKRVLIMYVSLIVPAMHICLGHVILSCTFPTCLVSRSRQYGAVHSLRASYLARDNKELYILYVPRISPRDNTELYILYVPRIWLETIRSCTFPTCLVSCSRQYGAVHSLRASYLASRQYGAIPSLRDSYLTSRQCSTLTVVCLVSRLETNQCTRRCVLHTLNRFIDTRRGISSY